MQDFQKQSHPFLLNNDDLLLLIHIASSFINEHVIAHEIVCAEKRGGLNKHIRSLVSYKLVPE